MGVYKMLVLSIILFFIQLLLQISIGMEVQILEAPTPGPGPMPRAVSQPCMVTKENVRPGMRVMRGKDWRWDNQDKGTYGTLTQEAPRPSEKNWWRVQWDQSPMGELRQYRVGFNGKYDLKTHEC